MQCRIGLKNSIFILAILCSGCTIPARYDILDLSECKISTGIYQAEPLNTISNSLMPNGATLTLECMVD